MNADFKFFIDSQDKFLGVLMRKINKEIEVNDNFPTVDRLVEITGKKSDVIKKSIKTLESLGFIKRCVGMKRYKRTQKGKL